MAKQKKFPETILSSPNTKSMTPGGKETLNEAIPASDMEKQAEEAKNAPFVRILFRGECAKLTPRGVGALEYEIGMNNEADEGFLRIARNESSGAFSTNWIGINEIKAILDDVQDQTFRTNIFRDLYMQKSSNNHGFLTAALRAEGVVVNLPKQLTVMRLESWDPLLEKIGSLKMTDVSLTDHIAIAAKKRGEEKAQSMAETKAKEKAKESHVVDT